MRPLEMQEIDSPDTIEAPTPAKHPGTGLAAAAQPTEWAPKLKGGRRRLCSETNQGDGDGPEQQKWAGKQAAAHILAHPKSWRSSFGKCHRFLPVWTGTLCSERGRGSHSCSSNMGVSSKRSKAVIIWWVPCATWRLLLPLCQWEGIRYPLAQGTLLNFYCTATS